jgi:hypothetical protein
VLCDQVLGLGWQVSSLEQVDDLYWFNGIHLFHEVNNLHHFDGIDHVNIGWYAHLQISHNFPLDLDGDILGGYLTDTRDQGGKGQKNPYFLQLRHGSCDRF